MTNVHPWIRNNRIVRDIPNYYIVDGVKTSNQKQEFDQIMKERGLKCQCIRTREAGRHNQLPEDGELVIREYDAHEGKEYFISWESKDREVIFGFVRLRITKNQCVDIFPELEDCALIRELHVYGKTIKVNDKNNGDAVQHIGIGKTLMNKAEEISKENGYNKVCVIAGIGTREYYKKIGYKNVETYMIKDI
jgi:ELP3 family radical SAM enzyme/protein acetyltransferase